MTANMTSFQLNNPRFTLKHLTFTLRCVTPRILMFAVKTSDWPLTPLGPKQNNPVCIVVTGSQRTYTALAMFPTRTAISLLDWVSFVWLCKSSKQCEWKKQLWMRPVYPGPGIVPWVWQNGSCDMHSSGNGQSLLCASPVSFLWNFNIIQLGPFSTLQMR